MFNLNTRKVFIDTETLGLNPFIPKIEGPFAVGMYDSKLNPWYREWEVDPYTRIVKPISKVDIKFLNSICSNVNIRKIFFNAKFDILMLNKIGIEVLGPIEEVYFMAKICKTNEPSYKLKVLANKYCGINNSDELDLQKQVIKCRRQAKKLGFKLGEAVEQDYWLPKFFDPKNTLCEKYCMLDVERTYWLYHMYREVMKNEPLFAETYKKEKKVFKIVLEAQKRGIRFSSKIAKQERESEIIKRDFHAKELLKTVNSLEDLRSNKKLAYYLFDKLKLTPTKFTPTGANSTGIKALQNYKTHPFVFHLLRYRSSAKAVNDFYDKYLEMKIYNNELRQYFLYPSPNQMAAITGRFSYSDPNLQQVPNPEASLHGIEKALARAPFGPRKDHIWYLYDYSQMEPKIFADVANIESMLEDIKNGKDLNDINGNKVFGGKDNPECARCAIIALELTNGFYPENPAIQKVWNEYGWTVDDALKNNEVSAYAIELAHDWLKQYDFNIIKAEASLGKKSTRSRYKTIFLAKLYGSGLNGIVNILNCTDQEGARWLAQIDSALPEIKEYSTEIANEARANGYIINRYGRKVTIDSDVAYKAANYMVQGTAADVVKTAMIKIDSFYRKEKLYPYWFFALQIHDELINECHKSFNDLDVVASIKSIMEDVEGHLNVPMTVDVQRVMSRWDKKEKVLVV